MNRELFLQYKIVTQPVFIINLFIEKGEGIIPVSLLLLLVYELNFFY
jgi:hypothetical protein